MKNFKLFLLLLLLSRLQGNFWTWCTVYVLAASFYCCAEGDKRERETSRVTSRIISSLILSPLVAHVCQCVCSPTPPSRGYLSPPQAKNRTCHGHRCDILKKPLSLACARRDLAPRGFLFQTRGSRWSAYPNKLAPSQLLSVQLKCIPL